MIRTFILLFLLGLLKTYTQAQDIALGQWQSHFSYKSAQHIVEAKNRIFCSTYNGLFSINPADNQVVAYSKANGLSDVGISSMAYDATANLLLLAYRNGNVDLLYLNEKAEPQEIINWPFLQDAAGLPESKRISKILFKDQSAYLSTNFGIIVINPRLREVVETYRYIGPNGTEVQVTDMTFTSDSLFAATSQGLLGTSLNSSINRQYFANWKTISTPYKAIAISYQNNSLYAGFSGQGIFKKNSEKWDVVYASTSANSSFSENLATLSNRIIVLGKDKPDVYENPIFRSLRESIFHSTFFWTADAQQGLLSNKDGTFKSYNPSQGDTTITVKKDSAIVDLNGLVWSRLPSYLGGGILVKNQKNNQQRVLSVAAGNGGLPSSAINSLAVDTDGFIWFASDRGVGYFIPDEILSGSRQDAILPVYGQRKLFSNERCNAIAVEPGNRKWIATNNGLFQFTADGSERITEFNIENSPLPSNQVRDLLFENETGLLFADTPNGMVSYRSDATTAQENLSAITIFPNPVRPGYEGNLGIKGLTDNSIVKITDLSGRLVYETRSQGGTASWNLNDYTGRRAKGGIYLIIIVSSDRREKIAGKLAVIW
ncbi:T9SS type A sorting domain-containing protein [Dyadobacter sp. LHD-138]|uniref:PorZ beta-propeller-like domain-containing protein n=1 Tax=Dyadobacter sp. LHD-138 TaxID=3071413 RepID=UPI0027E10082|nr:T9SS type A sorting domain-containing protein [Dyadobacter sp. LHD-138]MDQ6478903.1 T9SS type A sorting domain-containing protein [Dyadobacter sp. LHD-138]